MAKRNRGWGGSRKGAGRPPGVRNKPRLIDGLPFTNDPLEWLINVMMMEQLPLRMRLAAAVAVMPYQHHRARPGFFKSVKKSVIA